METSGSQAENDSDAGRGPSTSSRFTSKSQDCVNCYIHAVSPVKKAATSDKKYFSCTLQLADATCKAVCFSPDKQSEMKTLEDVKSPVNMQNYKRKLGFGGKDEIVIHKLTKLTPLAESDVDFTHNPLLSQIGVLPNISSIQKLALEQLLSIKAHVLEVSPLKHIDSQKKGKFKKQEVLVGDPTTTIKIVLWQDSVNTLSKGSTYILENLRLKANNNQRFLNTAKGVEFKYTKTEPFQTKVAEPDEPLSFDTKIDSCKVLGVVESSKQLSCFNCFKKVLIQPNSTLAKCSSCSMTQIKTKCCTQWFLRVMFEYLSGTDPKSVVLNLFNMQVAQLHKALNLDVNLTSCTEEDLLIAILTSTKQISLTYNASNKRVSEVMPLNNVEPEELAQSE